MIDRDAEARALERRIQSLQQALSTLDQQVLALLQQTLPNRHLGALHHLVRQAGQTMKKLQDSKLRLR